MKQHKFTIEAKEKGDNWELPQRNEFGKSYEIRKVSLHGVGVDISSIEIDAEKVSKGGGTILEFEPGALLWEPNKILSISVSSKNKQNIDVALELYQIPLNSKNK